MRNFDMHPLTRGVLLALFAASAAPSLQAQKVSGETSASRDNAAIDNIIVPGTSRQDTTAFTYSF